MPIESDKKWLLSYRAKSVKKIFTLKESNFVVSIQLKSFMEVDLMKVTRYQHIFKKKRHENRPIESDKTLLLSYIAKSVKKIFTLKVPKLCC